MLDKSQGAVGCSHCKSLAAQVESCAVCGQAICTDCSQERCPEPHARPLRLGLGRRLRAVDETGRLGLVSSWNSMTYRLADLEQGRWVEAQCPPHPYKPWPLLAGGRVVLSQRAPNSTSFHHVLIKELWPGGRQTQIETAVTMQPPRVMRPGHELGLCVVVSDNEAAEVLDLARCQVIASISDPGQMIHAVEASTALDLVALGSYRRATLYRLGGGPALTRLKLLNDNLYWIGLSRTRIALLDVQGRLEVYPLNPESGAVGSRLLAVQEIHTQGRLQCDLSPDGRLLACVRAGRLVLLDLDGSDEQILSGHTDTIHLVRFAREGRLLISADEDNRVICWPTQGGDVVTCCAPEVRLARHEPLPFDAKTMRVDLAPLEAASLSD